MLLYLYVRVRTRPSWFGLSTCFWKRAPVNSSNILLEISTILLED